MSFPTTNAALARALAARGYSVPTAVQLAVLEAEADRDLLVSAQTGSGKTVAFGLAMGPTLLGEAERFGPPAAPLALVIAPTRELAMQVCRELTWLYEETGARVITCVGGMDARAEARQLQGGAHIVVGTPGRLRDHLERGRLDLSQLQAAVLDEADEMLNLGFREDLEFILEATRAERRTLLFSATLPREIEQLARKYQRDALRIQTIRRDEQHVDIDYIAHRVSPQDVEHCVVNVLRLNEARAALVFCSTREAVNRFSARLVERGFAAVALSGELTQHERTQALQSLRDGRARVLVATDVAARGLDLPDLALVIHAELPNDAETLLHRSGRTGRAGRKGQCVLIVPFNRRKKADTLIAGARLKITWAPAPTPDEIRVRDQERFVADSSFTLAASEEEAQRVQALQAARTADEIALALVRLHDARLPAPEDLMADSGPPSREGRAHDKRGFEGRVQRDAFKPRGERAEGGKFKPRHEKFQGNGEGGKSEGFRAGPRDAKPRREDNREMVWFRLNIGRERNADPRWLLPLICRAGAVTKAEIGAIRIEDKDTRFQIAAEFADQFDLAARTAKQKEGHIVRLDGNEAHASPAGSAQEATAAFVKPQHARKRSDDTSARDGDWKKPGKPSGKPDWKKDGKSKGGWTPRNREDRGAAPRDATKGPGKSPGARPAEPVGAKPSYFNKKKHRASQT
jgi:ATP-dependent RNA helicase DeaD